MSPPGPTIQITPVRTTPDLNSTIALFTAYASSLNLDLSFQSFSTEMSSMPGKYSPELGGELFLAKNSETGEGVGCVGLRPLPTPSTKGEREEPSSNEDGAGSIKTCEMKRLYVSPAGRGTGVGRKLVEIVIKRARELGYEEIRLDTLPSMKAAIGLYQEFGFRDIERYYDTPLEGTRFLGLKLS